MVQDFPLSIFRPGRFSFSPSPLISYPASAGFIGNEFSFGRTHEWKKKLKVWMLMINMTMPESLEGEECWDKLQDDIRSDIKMIYDDGVLGMARIQRVHLLALELLNVGHWLRDWSWFGRLVNTCKTIYEVGVLLEIWSLLPMPPQKDD